MTQKTKQASKSLTKVTLSTLRLMQFQTSAASTMSMTMASQPLVVMDAKVNDKSTVDGLNDVKAEGI